MEANINIGMMFVLSKAKLNEAFMWQYWVVYRMIVSLVNQVHFCCCVCIDWERGPDLNYSDIGRCSVNKYE